MSASTLPEPGRALSWAEFMVLAGLTTFGCAARPRRERLTSMSGKTPAVEASFSRVRLFLLKRHTSLADGVPQGDGVFYCDMTGSGSDDYVWTYNDAHAAEFYGNIHSPPDWKIGSKTMFNLQRPRRSLHIVDWTGDGKCDLISQRKSDGALELWRNDYDRATDTFAFSYQGFISGASGCTEGWGVGLFDQGLHLADIE